MTFCKYIWSFIEWSHVKVQVWVDCHRFSLFCRLSRNGKQCEPTESWSTETRVARGSLLRQQGRYITVLSEKSARHRNSLCCQRILCVVCYKKKACPFGGKFHTGVALTGIMHAKEILSLAILHKNIKQICQIFCENGDLVTYVFTLIYNVYINNYENGRISQDRGKYL